MTATVSVPTERTSFGAPWLALAVSLGIHVADEALNDFLSVYNPAVTAIRERLPFFPMPTFTFGVWLAGLIVAVAVLLALSPLAFRGSFGLRRLAWPLAILMLFNGLGHFAGSLYLGRAMPGVYSSPALLASSIYLLVTLGRSRHQTAAAAGLP